MALLPPEHTQATTSAEEFEGLLTRLTGIHAHLPNDVVTSLRSFIATAGSPPERPREEVERDFYARMSEKMRLNAETLAKIHKQLADLKTSLNFHQRKRIALSVNRAAPEELALALEAVGISGKASLAMATSCTMATREQARSAILKEARTPTKLRKLPDRNVASDVKSAAVGALVATLWPDSERYRAVGAGGEGEDASDYVSYLQAKTPELFNRDRALTVRRVAADEAERAGRTRSGFEPWLREEYAAISNHGYLGVILEIPASGKSWAWDTALDLITVAERLVESDVKQMFFRWRDVERETVEHLRSRIDLERAAFSKMNEGFTYRDTFVLTDTDGSVLRLVLTFQKNARDETLVPCPSCRSSQVEGNSYPTLGVKSWACANLLCPDRSIYNRGKRYQFKSILQQAAIEDPANQIDVSSVRRWQRDVVQFIDDAEVINTLIAHYSMLGDGVRLINVGDVNVNAMGRRATVEVDSLDHTETDFWESAFFARYTPIDAEDRTSHAAPLPARPGVQKSVFGDVEIVVGDSRDVLTGWQDGSVDMSITSPPYFNAREYAQWPNLYTYLHDMIANAREVFRVLKPGGVYAYNIFDYFDNERTVVFSDMGRKRVALASLIADGFRRIGFELAGVTVWDKGEIHGKRGFNGGNYSPFYQSPFNCWEHVLLFRKPDRQPDSEPFETTFAELASKVLKVHPVVKMIRGENILGHTAPFPERVPSNFIQLLSPGSTVLDPYAGSGTTGIAALNHGLRAVLIERDEEYARLMSRRIADTLERLALGQKTEELAIV